LRADSFISLLEGLVRPPSKNSSHAGCFPSPSLARSIDRWSLGQCPGGDPPHVCVFRSILLTLFSPHLFLLYSLHLLFPLALFNSYTVIGLWPRLETSPMITGTCLINRRTVSPETWLFLPTALLLWSFFLRDDLSPPAAPSKVRMLHSKAHGLAGFYHARELRFFLPDPFDSLSATHRAEELTAFCFFAFPQLRSSSPQFASATAMPRFYRRGR